MLIQNLGMFTNIHNPHLPNGLSHPYQLDESFFAFKGCLVYFYNFYHIVDRNSCKQTVEFALFAYVPKKERHANMG